MCTRYIARYAPYTRLYASFFQLNAAYTRLYAPSNVGVILSEAGWVGVKRRIKPGAKSKRFEALTECAAV